MKSQNTRVFAGKKLFVENKGTFLRVNVKLFRMAIFKRCNSFLHPFLFDKYNCLEAHDVMGQRDVVVASDMVGFLSSPEFNNKLNVLNSFAINVLSFNELFVYLYPIF